MNKFIYFTDSAGVLKAIPRSDIRLITFHNEVVEITYHYEPSNGYITEKIKESFMTMLNRLNKIERVV